MKKIETKYIVAIIISLIISVSILGYGYMNNNYKNKALEQKTKSEEQINSTRQLQIQNCLDDVADKYSKVYEGAKNISSEEVKIIIDLNQKQKDECFRKFQ